MISNSLTRNAYKYLVADFLWNFGRTLPHAILTIYLLQCGISLTRIAVLQSVFMIVAMCTEFPSGVFADRFSRKGTYILSVVLLATSYILIGIYAGHFEILLFAYILYGLSTSLKTGTLDAEVIIELRQGGYDVKSFSVSGTYALSVSSLLGGLLGSILFSVIGANIYFISVCFYVFASVVAFVCRFHNKEPSATPIEKRLLKADLQDGFSLLKNYSVLRRILILSALSALFLQPFFQYWQVLYRDTAIPVSAFGTIYVVFQLCSFVGAFIYRRIKERLIIFVCILVLIPIVYALTILWPCALPAIFPLAVILFCVYAQHIDVICQRVSPEKHMSSYISLVGTITNIASMASLFIMSVLIEKIGVQYAYLILFIIFACSSVIAISVNSSQLFQSHKENV